MINQFETQHAPGENQTGHGLDWELILDSMKDMAASAAKSTVALCEEDLLSEDLRDPDEVVRCHLYNNIGAVKDLYGQLQLLSMPERVKRILDSNPFLQWTPQDVAKRLSSKARRRWLRVRYIFTNKSKHLYGFPDFDANDLSQF